ncbi:MAG: TonB family protein [Janthinobacterium lividum]
MRARYGILLATALGASPLPSYALADNIISQLVGGLLFIVACAVAAIAVLSALLALVAGNGAVSKKSALVALVALISALLLKPAPTYTPQSPEEALAAVAHPFGLVMGPDTTDLPTEIPPLRTDTAGRSNTRYGKVYTYTSDMPKLPGGKTEAIGFVQQNLRYPAAAREHGTVGLVFVDFIVREDGEVCHARVKKGLGDGCDEEALRVVRGLPAFQNNAETPTQFTWAFSFRPPEALPAAQ